MAFIYKITNKISGKSYIGKTEESVDKRVKQHLNDSVKDRYRDRPLYRAINKYGFENFQIEIIEETSIASEREKYWIDFYQTYGKLGYNATKGGDGKKTIDYEFVVSTYLKLGQDFDKTVEFLGNNRSTIRKILISEGFDVVQTKKRGSKVSTSKITEEDVIEIRRLQQTGIGYRKISKVLNISVYICRDVVYNKNWKHVEI